MIDPHGASWLLLGSGPSAYRCGDDRARGLPVACVNGSLGALRAHLPGRDPDAYGVFENAAALAYKSALEEYAAKGRAYMRPYNAGLINLERQAVLIDENFGPPELRDLHLSRVVPGPRYNPETWISSGVLMLWVLLEREKPSDLWVAGQSGYPVGEPEYHPSVAPLDTRPERTPEWCAQMNAHMSEAVGRLSRHYTGTRIHWLNKPLHYSPDWNVDIR